MENDLILVKDEDIEINFFLDGEEYVVLKSDDDKLEEVNIAKVVTVNDEYDTLASLTEEEYEKAFDEYIAILEDFVEDEEDE